VAVELSDWLTDVVPVELPVVDPVRDLDVVADEVTELDAVDVALVDFVVLPVVEADELSLAETVELTEDDSVLVGVVDALLVAELEPDKDSVELPVELPVELLVELPVEDTVDVCVVEGDVTSQERNVPLRLISITRLIFSVNSLQFSSTRKFPKAQSTSHWSPGNWVISVDTSSSALPIFLHSLLFEVWPK
jgi:hypothetical protein